MTNLKQPCSRDRDAMERSMRKINNEISFWHSHLAGVTLFCYLILLAGCKVGPDYKPPEVQVPEAWIEPVTTADTRSSESIDRDLATWWTLFRDPVLTSLIERAVVSNLDLRWAEARVREARAARAATGAGLGPSIDATGSFKRSRSTVTVSETGPGIPGGSRTHTEGVISNQYQAGFDAGWELDIFGGVRRGVEAAEADLRSVSETRRDVLVTLVAEVARDYIDLRRFQERLTIARRNLKAQRHSADLTRRRFEGGFVGALDVANAEAQAATTAAQIPSLETSVRQTLYRLSVLLAREPANLMEELSVYVSIPEQHPPVPIGVPSDLLRRRPDIRRAEADIQAATARIGVATADLFPRFYISGTFGFSGSESGSWTDWANRIWSLGPSASWSVFNSGQVRANIRLREAVRDQTLVAYQQTVLSALQEVENALIASAKEKDRRTSLLASVVANRKAVDLAMKLYAEGETDFLNVLSAQRSLYSSEDALAQSTHDVYVNLVGLYKAAGGGW